MRQINDLLSKFKNLLTKEDHKKTVIQNCVKKITGIEVNKQNIKIKKGIIYLNIKPIFKNEIFLKKEEILKSIKEVLPNKSTYKFN